MKGKMLERVIAEAVHTHTHTSSFIEKGIKNRDKSYQGINLSIGRTATDGITLVALVVTIVVLLILAGITITYVMGDNSIFKKAQEAKNKMDQAIQNEQDELGELANLLKGEYSNETGGEETDPPTPPEIKVPATSLELNSVRARIATGYIRWLTATVEPTNASLEWTSSDTNVAIVDNEGKVTAKTVGTTTITVTAKKEDGTNLSKECSVTVVDGVDISILTSIQSSNKIAKDSYGNLITVPGGFKVLTSQATNATKGIVIQDSEGNEFVWVPVDSVSRGENIRADDIRLGRYTFDSNGKETLIQESTNYASTTEDTKINGDFQELEISSYGNTTAKSLGTFVSKTNSNGGYYLGRYEASKGTDNKVKSKSAKVWNNITQPNAATAARNMYNSNYVESDLINSYSWDTAIVFIQKYSGNTNYANKASVNTSLANTGANNDKVCNICDMASNTREWTTETFNNSASPCTNRGGRYNVDGNSTASRGHYGISSSYDFYSFRSCIYLK